MPTIPQTQQFISSDVSFANPTTRGAGAIGAAAANVGDTLTDIGTNLLKEVKETEARDQSSMAFYEDKSFAQDTIAQLQKDYPDGYYKDEKGERVKNKNNTGDKTISDVYHEIVSKRYKERQMKFSTQMGQSLYTQKAGPLFSETHIALRNQEQILHTDAFRNNLDKLIEQISSDAFLVPDTNFNYTNLDDLAGRISSESGKLLTPDEAKGLQSKSATEITKKRFQGKMNEIEFNIRYNNDPQARNQEIVRLKLEVEGTDSVSVDRNKKGLKSFSDMLSSDDKVLLSQQILRLSQNVSKKSRQEFGVFYEEEKSRASRGKGVSPGFYSTLNSYVQSEAVGPSRAQQIASEITGIASAGALVSSPEFLNASTSDRYKMADAMRKKALEARKKLPDGEVAGAGEKDAHRSYQTAVDGHTRAYKLESTNAADFQATVPGSPQQDIDKTVEFLNVNSLKANKAKIRKAAETAESGYMLRHRTYKGFSPVKEQVLKSYVDYFKGGGITPASNEAKAYLLSTIRETWGDKYYKTIIDQLIGSQGLPEKWRIAGYITSDLTKIDFMDALTNNSDIVAQNFETNNKGAVGKTRNDVNKAVDKYFSEWSKTVSRENPGDPRNQAVINGIVDFARTKVMLMSADVGSGTIDDNAKKVFDDVVKKTQHILQLKTYEGKGYKINLPKKYYSYTAKGVPVEKTITEDQTQNFHKNQRITLSKENLQKQGIVLQNDAGKQSKYDEHFYEHVSKTAYATVKQGKVFFYYRPQNSTTAVLLFKKDPKADGGISPYTIELEEFLNSPQEDIPYNPAKVIERRLPY